MWCVCMPCNVFTYVEYLDWLRTDIWCFTKSTACVCVCVYVCVCVCVMWYVCMCLHTYLEYLDWLRTDIWYFSKSTHGLYVCELCDVYACVYICRVLGLTQDWRTMLHQKYNLFVYICLYGLIIMCKYSYVLSYVCSIPQRTQN